ncbi:MAG: D-2-hydroxyacid dehydrogenase [Woeseiaceae bacterium]|nr:D-2-hydroxyacid dehydrogenase [Woeseiaceae bacterium]
MTAAAEEYAAELQRLAADSIPFKACTSVGDARSQYANETILFGRPDMIAELLPHMPAVDWVQSSWAGVTPLIEADRRDYQLTGVKDVFGPQMSEYVIGYLLAHELRLRERWEKQQQHEWFNEYSGSLEGKHLGIMGTGSIGRHIAQTAGHFGVDVTGLSRSGNAAPGFSRVMQQSELHAFLKPLDYLVAILPDTRETNHLLDAAALAQLPRHAYFINIGRSNVVDDAALIDALKNARLAGATLDVFDEEPIPADSPLWDTPRLLVTAHIAAVSLASLIVPIFIDNHHRYVNGEPLNHRVDFDAGY